MKKVLLMLVVLLLSACGSNEGQQTAARPPGASGGGTNPQAPAELQYIFEVPADPLRVIASLDNSRQAESMISTAGGSLSTTGADGTVYRLDIPADALVADTLVRMTPINLLEGMALGSESYGVQLEPESLKFYDLAFLTITPARDIPPDQQIFFGYHGEGENLTLAAPNVDSSDIQILIHHFSGYGVTKGFLADIEPIRARIGGEAETRLQSAVAEQLTRARQEQLLGIENGTEIDWEGLFRQWEEEVVRPRIAAAGESCAAGRLAIDSLLSYERQRQLLGVGETTIDTGLLDTVAEVCMKEEYELCRDEHIIHRILDAWLGLEREYNILGLAGEGVNSAVLENAKNYVRRCLTFELEFHSEALLDDGDDGGFDSVVDSRIKIQIFPEELKMRGQAPLVNTAFDFRVPGCTVSSNRGGGTFDAMSLAYIRDTKTPIDQVGYVRDFRLVYYPGDTSESFEVSCNDGGSYTSPASPLWTGVYLVTHRGEMSLADGAFVAEDWEIFGEEYYAKKEWVQEEAEEGVVEVGTFKLYHRPE